MTNFKDILKITGITAIYLVSSVLFLGATGNADLAFFMLIAGLYLEFRILRWFKKKYQIIEKII